ncbi:MAG: hypothetical protein ACYC6X_03855 [Minisyncoccota bacterium]
MPPKMFERLFKKNLDDDKVFDREVSKEASKVFGQIGVNQPGLHSAYAEVQRLNRERTSPHHKNYLLNIIQAAAFNSDRIAIELQMNPTLERDIKNEIEKMRLEDEQ